MLGRINGKWVSTLIPTKSLLNRVPFVPACQSASVPAWFRCQVLACQRGLRAKSVPGSHFYVPTCQKTCQRAIRLANVSTWHANVPNDVPIFQLCLPTCQRACQLFKHSYYELLREISILFKTLHYTRYYTYTYHVCMYCTCKLYYIILFETFLLFR